MARNKTLVFCSDHDGFQAFFMMEANDFRVSTPEARAKFNYLLLDSQPVYTPRLGLLTSIEGCFQVMPDWSLKPSSKRAEACAQRMLAAFKKS